MITGDTVLAADTGQVMWIQGSFDGLRVTDNKIVASNGPLETLLAGITSQLSPWVISALPAPREPQDISA